MRFMMLVKHQELSGPPPKALMDAIDKLAEESVKNKTMVLGGGLAPMAATTRVRVSGGKVTATDGPFSEGRKRSKAQNDSWTSTASTGPNGRAKPKFAKSWDPTIFPAKASSRTLQERPATWCYR